MELSRRCVKLLDTACLEVKDRQLALTACTVLTFASMKSALKRLFGGTSSAITTGISRETAYVTEHRRQRNKQWPKNNQQKTPALILWTGVDVDRNVQFAKALSIGLPV